MLTRLGATQLPPDEQSTLSRLRTRLGKAGLLAILDSLPAGDTFRCIDSTFRKNRAIKIRLGQRRQVNGDLATSWAFIELEQSDIVPPVRFRDEDHGPAGHDHSRFFNRSASSLVLEAQDLLPPFRFMGRGPYNDEVPNMRGMLCALVLYYALVQGLSNDALQWKQFHASLEQALTYIGKQATYHLWLDDANERVSSQETITAPPSTTSDTRIASQRNGGAVRSRGSSMSPPAGCGLADFMEVLGKNASLLDYIPSVPVTIERQDVEPGQFPFRLLFGQYGGADVHVYLPIAGQRVKIMLHSPARTWTHADLGGLKLLEPFLSVTRFQANTAPRHNKMRYLIAYYFWIAEAEGLIDAPPFTFSPRNAQALFVSLCKSFKLAGVRLDTCNNSMTQGKDSKGSLIVQLQLAPEALSILDESDSEEVDGRTDASRLESRTLHNDTPPTNSDMRLSNESTSEIPAVPTATSSTQSRSLIFLSNSYNAEVTRDYLPTISSRRESTAQSSRAASQDSGFMSEYNPPSLTVDGMKTLAQITGAEEAVGKVPVDEAPAEDPTQEFPTRQPDPDEMEVDEAPAPSVGKPEESRPQEMTTGAVEQSYVQDHSDEMIDEESREQGLAPDAMNLDHAPLAPCLSVEVSNEDHTLQQTIPDVSELGVEPDRPIEGQPVEGDGLPRETEFDMVDLRTQGQSVEDQPLEEQLVEEQLVEDQPLEEQLVEEQLVEDQPLEDQQVEDQPVEEQPLEEQPLEEHLVEDQQVDDQQVDDLGLAREMELVVDSTPERDPVVQRQPSVLLISSDDEIEPVQPKRPAPRTNLQGRSPLRRTSRNYNPANVIDLSRDYKESIEVDTDNLVRPTGLQTGRTQRRQIRHIIYINDDDDGDEIIEDLQGDAWKRASWRQRPGS